MNLEFKAVLGSILSLVITGTIIYFIISLVAGVIKFILVAGVILLAIGISYTYIRSLFKNKN
jgi:hypothetical protein